MVKRRTRYEIYSELLEIATTKGYTRVTRASYGANLPVDRAKESLTFLASRGFLKEENFDDSKIYRITKRGLEYLETFRHMRKLFAALDEKSVTPQIRTAEGPPAGIEATFSISKNEAEVLEDVNLEIKLLNVGVSTVKVSKIEGIIPDNFEVVAKPDRFGFEGASSLDTKNVEVAPKMAEEIRLTLRAHRVGKFVIRPKIMFLNEAGQKLFVTPKPVQIGILKTDLPPRLSTGYSALDNLLLGGLPGNYAVLLTSPSCDERDLLILRFLEAGIRQGQMTFYVTTDANMLKPLSKERDTSNLHVFICNPQADAITANLSNAVKLKGIENLTDINISLTSALRRTDTLHDIPKRIYIEILSDILLQHGPMRTRKWLTGILPELKSKGFTTLMLLNFQMHSAEEVQAVLDPFEGEINIYEKEISGVPVKHLQIRKMFNQRYLENEMPLIKEQLRIRDI